MYIIYIYIYVYMYICIYIYIYSYIYIYMYKQCNVYDIGNSGKGLSKRLQLSTYTFFQKCF